MLYCSQGFPRLLVDLGKSRKIDRTELVLVTHRRAEIPDEVQKAVAVKDLQVRESTRRATLVPSV
jgi:ABC-type molybdenum transport system ATPase subunit/photorepair protein PhrA